MKIRKANLKDIHQITKIAAQLKIVSPPQKNGFLVYVLNEGDYRARLISKYFYVAEEKDRVVAFIMAYNNLIINKLIESGDLTHQSNIIKFLLKQKKPFIWGDQIGVLKEYAKQGIGGLLMDRLISQSNKNKISAIYVDILHNPFRNEASISFCTKKGFNQIREIENSDKKIWGIYKKTIKGNN
jgi:N-acetylglutamate synthase-like GNAT family acetyltransferase